MNWESFKEQVAYKVKREVDRQSPPLTHGWTIGDGRIYKTRKQAEVMSIINWKGSLFVETVLSSRETARAVDQLIEQGVIKSIESDREDVLKFEIL